MIGGFKTDDGEAQSFAGNRDTERGVYIRPGARFADGRTGAAMRNAYCVEYHRAVWEVLGADGVIFARSGFTGTQAFPGCWAGDNQPDYGEANGLPSVIVAGLSAAMSGGKSAKEALEDSATAWEQVTERIGRDQQLKDYQAAIGFKG